MKNKRKNVKQNATTNAFAMRALVVGTVCFFMEIFIILLQRWRIFGPGNKYWAFIALKLFFIYSDDIH